MKKESFFNSIWKGKRKIFTLSFHLLFLFGLLQTINIDPNSFFYFDLTENVGLDGYHISLYGLIVLFISFWAGSYLYWKKKINNKT